MKNNVILALILSALSAKGMLEPVWKIPEGITNFNIANGQFTGDTLITTRAYQLEALNKVVFEANTVAKELNLPEDLPITKANIIGAFIHPFGFAYLYQKIGNVTTSNYCYCVSIGNKFSYVNEVGWEAECKGYQKDYVWPKEKMDTHAALRLATKWLKAVHMDVKALNRDLPLVVKMDNEVVWAPPGKFVPVYYVAWQKRLCEYPHMESESTNVWVAVASVRLFLPTKTLLELRVEDSKYILRPPIVFTNLAELLAQTNASARP